MRLVAHFFVFILGILMILFRFLTGQAVGFKPDPDGNCRLVYRIFPPPSTLRRQPLKLNDYAYTSIPAIHIEATNLLTILLELCLIPYAIIN
jgi:hypothetical protein